MASTKRNTATWATRSISATRRATTAAKSTTYSLLLKRQQHGPPRWWPKMSVIIPAFVLQVQKRKPTGSFKQKKKRVEKVLFSPRQCFVCVFMTSPADVWIRGTRRDKSLLKTCSELTISEMTSPGNSLVYNAKITSFQRLFIKKYFCS